MCVCSVVYDSLQTPWTVALQAPLSMGFSRQEYLSGLPFPPAGNLPDLRIEPMSPALAGGFFTTQPPRKTNLIPYPPLKRLPEKIRQPGTFTISSRQELTIGPDLPFLYLLERAYSIVKVTWFCPTLWNPHGLCHPWNSPGQNTKWIAFPFSTESSFVAQLV